MANGERPDDEAGGIAPAYLLMMVAMALGLLVFLQVGHATVLGTEARNAADAAALAGARSLRDQLLATPGWGLPAGLNGFAVRSAAVDYANRNGATLVDFDSSLATCRVRAEVRGRTGPLEGPVEGIQNQRPESEAAAEVTLPPLGAYGLEYRCQSGLGIVDLGLVESLVPRPPIDLDDFELDPPDPDEFDDPEDFADAVEDFEEARDAWLESVESAALDAWRDTVADHAFGMLRDGAEIRLVPTG
ncbi:MAG TPA: pilus assembly protein TadG-related protein [Egicoccus sp.]|nr:pilus assembly protein TadG-related protein [Egicoccus sp.]HSK22832.1 pilus assembly protein TadG-related protein [Egicoccus sp.]